MPPIDQPAWLAHAWAELGQHETPGSETNPHIRAFFADAGQPEVSSDETAWCAAFVGACLQRAGIPPSGSLLARSYLTWGELTLPRLGAIAVFSRDGDPTLGHVGFLVGETPDSFLLLGGNQHDAVTVAAFPKSRLLSLRWPSLDPLPVPSRGEGRDEGARSGAFVEGEGRQQAANLFPIALAHVLEMEGGFTNDPADPGGPTNFGITLTDYARFRQQPIDASTRADLNAALEHIDPTDVRTIYLDRYWTPAGCPQLPVPLAFFHFDTAVNMGTGTAIRMLQTALGCAIGHRGAMLRIDGEIGPVTLAAAATSNPRTILAAYADLRRRRYRNLSTFPRFGRGWLARVDTTLARALKQGIPNMTDQSANVTPSPKWWGHSLTIWGAVITGLAAVLPALGPAIGVEISPQTIHTSADQVTAIVQAAIGLAGTLAAIFGRVRATQPLEQRSVTLKL